MIVVNTLPKQPVGEAVWTIPSVSDNSGQVTLHSDYDSGDRFPYGNTTVTYTATDGSGNQDIAYLKVVVNGMYDTITPGSKALY